MLSCVTTIVRATIILITSSAAGSARVDRTTDIVIAAGPRICSEELQPMREPFCNAGLEAMILRVCVGIDIEQSILCRKPEDRNAQSRVGSRIGCHASDRT